MASGNKGNQLTAEPRTETKGSALRKLRLNGRIPAVVYGSDMEGTPVSVDAKEFKKLIRTGRSEMFDLVLEGGRKVPVLIKDYQERDGKGLHADFLKISKNKPIRVRIAIDYQGTAEGTKTGGILQVQETELEVEALPDNLPSVIEADISAMAVGDKLTAGDIKLPDKVHLISPAEELLASIVIPRAVEAENEAAENTAEEERATEEGS
ncbi:50S ribosomal protein L25 [Paenibacillus sp. P96]|uniref:Large ribosomal subunit protein bL25 n=1 Tax=Paenibacillus zeirhizosphaerae TaxID=2987519 RepID=A0ABT9FLK4_9BACL|nr:50S ribosomal protein L25 [Paenibacillus sp. P96]MDP4095262.1 50S ribosomal protein L25 [Paenibacillus sp. P96]